MTRVPVLQSALTAGQPAYPRSASRPSGPPDTCARERLRTEMAIPVFEDGQGLALPVFDAAVVTAHSVARSATCQEPTLAGPGRLPGT